MDTGLGLVVDALASAGEPSLLAHVDGVRGPFARLVTLVDELEPGFDPSSIDVGAAAGHALGLRLPPALNGAFARAGVWPQAHRGKDFSLWSAGQAALSLRDGGSLLCAAKKSKGLASLSDALAGLGPVRTLRRDAGYHLIEVTVEAARARAWAQSHEARYECRDERTGVAFTTQPGVFSRKHLDPGTAALIDVVSRRFTEWGHLREVMDAGAGAGPLTLWLAERAPTARVHAFEVSLMALESLTRNVDAAGLGSRVKIHAGSAWPLSPELEASRRGAGEGGGRLAVSNPPTHATPEHFLEMMRALLAFAGRGGHVFVVVNRSGRALQGLAAPGVDVRVHDVPGFHVIEARPSS